ncbi:MAG TPA: flagellar hook-associated protein 3 [Candidatus Hydrogenedentes bacterium]|nr:flagellar hook-associated protein 3 [Candidatus Hydrogenedentota bacterium]
MGAIRVTQRLLVDRVLRNLSHQSRRILNLQDQLATGQKVNRPSDNPLAARRAVNLRMEIARNKQYLANISTMGPFMQESETAIMTVEQLRQRANELTIQGLSDTNGPLQRAQIAIEINQLLEDLLSQSNYITANRYVFGGTNTNNAPFVAARNAEGEITDVTYAGNDEYFQIEISDGVLVNVNETGRSVFMQTAPGTVDLFDTLIAIRDNLRANDTATLSDNLESLHAAQGQLMMAVARLGATQNRIERVDASLRDVNVQLQRVLSDNIDADFAEVIINLNAQTNAYQAALNAGARVIVPSLLEFLG